MRYVEYAIVGLLVLTAAAYAVLRIRRALQGRDCGCAFMRGSGAPCASCPRDCESAEVTNSRKDAQEAQDGPQPGTEN